VISSINLDWYMFQLPAHTKAKCLSSSLSEAFADMISCDGWPDSYQEHNALKPHCMNTITNGMRGMLSPGSTRGMAVIMLS